MKVAFYGDVRSASGEAVPAAVSGARPAPCRCRGVSAARRPSRRPPSRPPTGSRPSASSSSAPSDRRARPGRCFRLSAPRAVPRPGPPAAPSTSWPTLRGVPLRSRPTAFQESPELGGGRQKAVGVGVDPAVLHVLETASQPFVSYDSTGRALVAASSRSQRIRHRRPPSPCLRPRIRRSTSWMLPGV